MCNAVYLLFRDGRQRDLLSAHETEAGAKEAMEREVDYWRNHGARIEERSKGYVVRFGTNIEYYYVSSRTIEK